ncbi:hypothetical protein V8C86DRAFT_2762638 [Haematococcus lacustris]
MHAKNLAYFVCTALALAFALPGLHATHMAQPSFVSRGACVSTAVNMAYLTILSVVLLCKPSLYERYRVILLASHLIGLSMPFSIFMHLMDTGVDDLFYQATLHLCLIPLMDLPVSATVLGAALLTPMYLALNWHSLQRQGLAPHSWGLLMLGRQAACCVAGVGGATLVHALVLEGFGSGSAGEPTMSTIVSTSASSSSYVRAGPGSCQPGVSARQLPGRRSGSVPPRVQQGLLLQRLESFLLHVKRSLSDQDRTLLLALLFVATPLACFLKFIRPFFDASLAHQPGPCELYVSFLCMFMLGSLQLDHMQQSIMSKLHISQVRQQRHTAPTCCDAGKPGRARLRGVWASFMNWRSWRLCPATRATRPYRCPVLLVLLVFLLLLLLLLLPLLLLFMLLQFLHTVGTSNWLLQAQHCHS